MKPKKCHLRTFLTKKQYAFTLARLSVILLGISLNFFFPCILVLWQQRDCGFLFFGPKNRALPKSTRIPSYSITQGAHVIFQLSKSEAAAASSSRTTQWDTFFVQRFHFLLQISKNTYCIQVQVLKTIRYTRSIEQPLPNHHLHTYCHIVQALLAFKSKGLKGGSSSSGDF